MAIIARDASDRVAQLIALAQDLTAFALAEVAAIQARRPPTSGPAQEDKIRLANAFRLEMNHLEADPTLIAGAPKAELKRLKEACAALEQASAAHRDALDALKKVSEGLLQAMAEEAARQRTAAGTRYGAQGGLEPGAGAPAVALDKRA
jgi:hypothetical protein